MSDSLKKFVKDNSKFLMLGDGETFLGTYKGFKVMPNSYDPEKEIVCYKLTYEDGKDIYWKTASLKVANIIADIPVGGKIKITRHGKDTDTKYDVSSPDVTKGVKDELSPDEELPEGF
jgi:hypothetical protein